MALFGLEGEGMDQKVLSFFQGIWVSSSVGHTNVSHMETHIFAASNCVLLSYAGAVSQGRKKLMKDEAQLEAAL